MTDYDKIYKLKEKFKKITSNTDLREPKFIQERDYIEISFIIYNECDYPIIFSKDFTNINELEDFINLLENIKITAQNSKYQVELIPIGIPKSSSFDIYINGEKVPAQSIDRYSEQSKIEANTKLREKIFFDISTSARETAYLFHQINDEEQNIIRCINLIEAIKTNQSRKEQKRLLKEHTPIPSYASIHYNNIYQIDLSKILTLAKKYIETKDSSAKEEILNEYNKIKEMIEKGYEINTNYWDIVDNLTSEDIHILLSFCENLEEIINNMKANAITILDYKKNQTKKLQNSINNVAKEDNEKAIDFISSITIDETNAPKNYKIFLPFPINQPPYAVFSNGKFNIKMDKNANVFKDIQRQQVEKLTIEERDALIYYKTILYRPINAVISLIRKKGITFDEALNNPDIFNEIINIISEKYDEYIERKKQIEKNPLPIAWRRNSNPKSVERLFSRYQNKTPNQEEYRNIVLLSVPLLESALNKIETTEDIIVYRGTNGIGINDDERFISTSLSLTIAKSFAKEEERTYENNEKKFSNIIQIIIPKGSHVIAYTDDLFTDQYDEARTLNEEQQEILIDPINFDFKLEYVNTNIIADGRTIIRINYRTIPKTREQQFKKTNK